MRSIAMPIGGWPTAKLAPAIAAGSAICKWAAVGGLAAIKEKQSRKAVEETEHSWRQTRVRWVDPVDSSWQGRLCVAAIGGVQDKETG